MGIAFVTDGLIQGNGLAGVLLDFEHLFLGDIHLLRQLLRGRLTAQVLQQLALDAAQLVDDFHHVHWDADGTSLVSHGASNGLADPPGGVSGELIALGVIELLHRADKAQVTFLNEVQESHATAGVALGQGNHQTQVGLQ